MNCQNSFIGIYYRPLAAPCQEARQGPAAGPALFLYDLTNQAAQNLDALCKLLVRGCGIVDAEALAGFALVGQERIARDDADLAQNRLLAERGHIDPVRQRAPHEEAALKRVVLTVTDFSFHFSDIGR